MKIYRNDDGTFFEITPEGYPYPIDKKKAWMMITEEGYEVENAHFTNEEETFIDTDKLRDEIERLQRVELDDELEITRDVLFYGIDRVKYKFDSYFQWARETLKGIPESEIADEPYLFHKGFDFKEKVQQGLAYKIADNLYIFNYGTFYLYGYLISNADFWRLIGVKVRKGNEDDLLKMARIDFSIINGIV